MTNPRPKQDGQTIDKSGMYEVVSRAVRKNEGVILSSETEKVYRVMDAIEAYCAEQCRLARIDEVDRVDASGWTTSELEEILSDRLAELQKQSSSQEAPQ